MPSQIARLDGERPESEPFLDEAELHAFVDGALEPADRARVATYLATHPEAAERAEAYRRQNIALCLLFDSVSLKRPSAFVGIPLRVQAVIRSQAKERLIKLTWLIATMIIGLAALGGVFLAHS